MAEIMSKGETVKRCWEARMMHRYGWAFIASTAPQDDQFGAVMVGDPKQEIIISVEADDG